VPRRGAERGRGDEAALREVRRRLRARLTEFVTGAGNTLYRGIGEILDRTLRERRERGDQIGEMRATTAAQQHAVHAARAALTQLRESAWAAPGEPTPTPIATVPTPIAPEPSDGTLN
jgi:hypothetical protein